MTTLFHQLPRNPDRSRRRPLRRAAALGGALTLCAVLAACGAPSSKARVSNADEIRQSTRSTTPPKFRTGPLDKPPEAYGLPPLAAVQADPAGVVKSLFAKSTQTAWSVTWLVLGAQGADAGLIEVLHLPAQGAFPPRLFVDGRLGSPEIKSYRVVVLDSGGGGRICVQEDQNPWSCDRKAFTPVLQFLSTQGFDFIATLLGASLNRPGVQVSEQFVTGIPAVCFSIPAGPVQGDKLGLDFTTGGSFCLSVDGALLRIDAGEVQVAAIAYQQGADVARFKLPL